jgi:hypothetical protein
MLHARVEYADRCSFDTHYYISSAPRNIERIASAARGHWGIESMHWLLDVEFKDDLSRYRTGHGAKNMAPVRRFALNLVRANKTKGEHQNPPKTRGLEPRIHAGNSSAKMSVNLDSVPCKPEPLSQGPLRSGEGLRTGDASGLCTQRAGREPLPVKNVKQLAEFIKANPGKYSFASAGMGTTSYLSGELFKLSLGADLVHVPFNGSAPAIQSTLGGHTPFAFVVLAPAVPLIREGKLTGLAVLSAQRSSAIPMCRPLRKPVSWPGSGHASGNSCSGPNAARHRRPAPSGDQAHCGVA